MWPKSCLILNLLVLSISEWSENWQIHKPLVVHQLQPGGDVVNDLELVHGLARQLVLDLDVTRVPDNVQWVQVLGVGLPLGREE